jgi:hypothetical protein
MVFDKSSAITDATSALKALLSLPSLTKFNNVSTMTVRAVNNLKKHEQFLINPAVLSFYQKLLINTSRTPPSWHRLQQRLGLSHPVLPGQSLSLAALE